jgi:staphylococcal nuclease domain-containing protein 1
VGARDRQPEPYALDARDFLRKKLIGKEVTVKMEYTRKIGFTPGQEAPAATPGQEVGDTHSGLLICWVVLGVKCCVWGRGVAGV